MKQYCFSTEIRTSDTGNMVLEGRAIVFNSPTILYEMNGIQFKEVITDRALDNTDMKDVVLRYNHSGEYTVLARTRNKSLQLDKRPDGLYMQANLQPEISQHRDIYEAVKTGLIDKMSFAFAIAEGGDSYDPATHMRSVNVIDKLYDLSIVDQPAYDQTFVEARSQIYQYIDTLEYRQALSTRLDLLKRRLSYE